jgi:hypothetical protein
MTPANLANVADKVPLKTPGGIEIPKLNLGGAGVGLEGKKIRGLDVTSDQKGKGHNRQLSDSSRGSIGRKERLRAALTGRSDGSGDGAD